MVTLPRLSRRQVRTLLVYAGHVLLIAMAVSSAVAGKADGTTGEPLSKADKQVQAEKRRQAKRMYSLFDHIVRICICTFLSAVFAGLTLGVMCADTFTLEIIAESGPAPDCKYAAQVLPLRKQGHKTLCTLIVTNMLCNTLIVQEFSSLFDIVYAIRTHGNTNNVVDDSGSQLLNFFVSTIVIVIFAEIVPMSICKSKYSLKVAAAGSVFVRVAMVITYPVSAPLGMFLDWVVGTEETGQVYDRKELRKLMLIHYDHESGNADMPKSELNLLLAAMDFQERRVKDIMTPIASATYVNENDVITPDFVERLWLSGRSRVPVESATDGHFCDVLVIKDLLTVSIGPDEKPMTVAQVVKARNRLFAMVGENTTLPAMMKFFQDAKTHMAVVFAEDHDGASATAISAAASTSVPLGAGAAGGEDASGKAGAVTVPSPTPAGEGDGATHATPTPDFSATARRSFAKNFTPTPANVQSVHSVGIVTMEDVVEELLNDEIYDEYDRYEPEKLTSIQDVNTSHSSSGRQAPRTPTSDPRVEALQIPEEPAKPPRVNFYSYFTHPEADVPLTDAQVWAVAYFLNRTVKAFMLWPPAYIKVLLDDSEDLQLVAPFGRGGSPRAEAAGTSSTASAVTSADTPVNKGRPIEDAASTAESTSVVAVPPIDLRSEHTMESSTGLGSSCPGNMDSPRSRAIQRFDHANFIAQAPDPSFVMYTMGQPSEYFTLVLGGQMDMLVGRERFHSRLRSFQFIGEEALTNPFYAPDFSAIIGRAARVYRISKERYETYMSYQTVRQRLHSHLRVLRAPQSAANLSNFGPPPTAIAPLAPTRGGRAAASAQGSHATRAHSRSAQAGTLRDRSVAGRTAERDRLLQRAFSESALEAGSSPTAKAYGTFKKDKY